MHSQNGPPASGGGMQFALPPLTPVTKKLMIANVAIFLVSWVMSLGLPSLKHGVYGILALDPGQWASWFPFVPFWQLVTSGFLHSTENLSHVLWNMVQLYFFGTMLEGVIGSRRFLVTYALCLVAGSLLHIFVELATGSPHPSVGASGAVLGIVVAMATMRPRTQIYVFFVPVMLWVVAAIVVALNFMNATSGLVLGTSDGVAHWVHLGGALYGFLCVRFGWIQVDWIERFRAKRAIAAEQDRRQDDFQMDQLLEKINREGMASLSKAEKSFLRRVSSRK